MILKQPTITQLFESNKLNLLINPKVKIGDLEEPFEFMNILSGQKDPIKFASAFQSRFNQIYPMFVDIKRIAKFFTSARGFTFSAKQTLLATLNPQPNSKLLTSVRITQPYKK